MRLFLAALWPNNHKTQRTKPLESQNSIHKHYNLPPEYKQLMSNDNISVVEKEFFNYQKYWVSYEEKSQNVAKLNGRNR
jgi:hypothetical protein